MPFTIQASLIIPHNTQTLLQNSNPKDGTESRSTMYVLVLVAPYSLELTLSSPLRLASVIKMQILSSASSISMQYLASQHSYPPRRLHYISTSDPRLASLFFDHLRCLVTLSVCVQLNYFVIVLQSLTPSREVDLEFPGFLT